MYKQIAKDNPPRLDLCLRTSCPNVTNTRFHFVEEDMDTSHDPQAEKAEGKLSMLIPETKQQKKQTGFLCQTKDFPNVSIQ